MQIHGNNIYKQKIHLLIAVKVQDKLQKYVVPFYAVCDGGWMSGGYPSSTDRSVHKFFTKYISTHLLIMEVDFCPVLCIPEVPVLQAFRGISHFVWYCKAVSDLS